MPTATSGRSWPATTEIPTPPSSAGTTCGYPRFPEWDITGELANVSCPLLLIQGERDQYGTLAQLDAIERWARGPVIRVHLDCQHSPPTELPVQTVAAITEFVSGLPRGDSAPPPAARTRR